MNGFATNEDYWDNFTTDSSTDTEQPDLPVPEPDRDDLDGQPTRVGHCQHDGQVYIGRGNAGDDGDKRHVLNADIGESGWLGNPYPIEAVGGRERSIELYAAALLHRFDHDREFRAALHELQGEVLGCWCRRLDENEPACHGDVLSRVIDAIRPTAAEPNGGAR